MDEPLRANRRLWDERARAHHRSAFYDVEGFKRRASRLHRIELERVRFALRGDDAYRAFEDALSRGP